MPVLLVVCLLLISFSTNLGPRFERLTQLHGQALRDELVYMINAVGAEPLLHLAVINGNLPLTELLVELGADLRSTDRNNLIPLRHAERIASEQQSIPHMRIASFLLEKTRGVNGGDEKGWRALVWSILARDIPRVKELLAKGADVFRGRFGANQQYAVGHQNAVWLAEHLGDDEIIEILAERAPDHYFPVAMAKGYRKFGQAMIARGIDVEVKDSSVLTAAMLIAKAGRIDDLRMLIANGAEIDSKVLFFAAYSGNPNLVKMVLEEHEVDVNYLVTTTSGIARNAIEAVLAGESGTNISKGRRKIIKMLIERGARVDFFNNDLLETKILAGETKAVDDLFALWNLYRQKPEVSLLQTIVINNDLSILEMMLSYLTDADRFLPQGIVALALVRTDPKQTQDWQNSVKQLLVEHATAVGLDKDKFISDADLLCELVTPLPKSLSNSRVGLINYAVAMAIKNDDLDTIKKLNNYGVIARRIGVNSSEISLLRDKGEQFQLEVLKILADNWLGELPLPVAVATGNYQMIRQSAIDGFFNMWLQAIDLARFIGDSKALALLLQHPSANKFKMKGLAREAVNRNDLELLELALDNGADPDGDSVPFTGEHLMHSIFNYNLPAVELLLSKGADPNLVYSYTITPLLASAGKRHKSTRIVEEDDKIQVEIMQRLVAAGAEIDADVFGLTPLGIAIKTYNPQLVEALLELGANRSQAQAQIDIARKNISSAKKKQQAILSDKLLEIEDIVSR